MKEAEVSYTPEGVISDRKKLKRIADYALKLRIHKDTEEVCQTIGTDLQVLMRGKTNTCLYRVKE